MVAVEGATACGWLALHFIATNWQSVTVVVAAAAGFIRPTTATTIPTARDTDTSATSVNVVVGLPRQRVVIDISLP